MSSERDSNAATRGARRGESDEAAATAPSRNRIERPSNWPWTHETMIEMGFEKKSRAFRRASSADPCRRRREMRKSSSDEPQSAAIWTRPSRRTKTPTFGVEARHSAVTTEDHAGL